MKPTKEIPKYPLGGKKPVAPAAIQKILITLVQMEMRLLGMV